MTCTACELGIPVNAEGVHFTPRGCLIFCELLHPLTTAKEKAA